MVTSFKQQYFTVSIIWTFHPESSLIIETSIKIGICLCKAALLAYVIVHEGRRLTSSVYIYIRCKRADPASPCYPDKNSDPMIL